MPERYTVREIRKEREREIDIERKIANEHIIVVNGVAKYTF